MNNNNKKKYIMSLSIGRWIVADIVAEYYGSETDNLIGKYGAPYSEQRKITMNIIREVGYPETAISEFFNYPKRSVHDYIVQIKKSLSSFDKKKIIEKILAL